MSGQHPEPLLHLKRLVGENRPNIITFEAVYGALLTTARTVSKKGGQCESLIKLAAPWERYLDNLGFPLPTDVPLAAWRELREQNAQLDVDGQAFRLGISEFLQDTALPMAFGNSLLKTPSLTVQPVPVRWHEVGPALEKGSVDAAIHNRSVLFQLPPRFPVYAHGPLYVFRGYSLYVRRDFVIRALKHQSIDQRQRSRLHVALKKGRLADLPVNDKLLLIKAGCPVVAVQMSTDLEIALRTTLTSKFGLIPNDEYRFFGTNTSDGLARLLSGRVDAFFSGLSHSYYLDRQSSTVLPLFERGQIQAVEVDGLVAKPPRSHADIATLDEVTRLLYRVHSVVRSLADQKDTESLGVILQRARRVQKKLRHRSHVADRLSVEDFLDIVDRGHEILLSSIPEALVYFPTQRSRDDFARSSIAEMEGVQHINANLVRVSPGRARRLLQQVLRLDTEV